MKKIINLFFSIMIVIFIALSAAGCGNDNWEDNGIVPEKDETGDITLDVFRWDFAQIDNARKQKSPIYQVIKEEIGADIKASTGGYSAWESVLNNRYNTGTLPDIFVCYGYDRPSTFKKWIKDGAVLPISDYVSETLYPNVYNYLNEYSFLVESKDGTPRMDYLNGKHYALPIKTQLTHGMYVRTDWIDNLNAKRAQLQSQYPADRGLDEPFKVPDTLIEFYRLAKAFSIYDPNNSGRNDTYGYTCSESNMWFNNWIFEAFGSTFFGMVEDGAGGLTNSFITDENKAAVGFLNRMYREGIMHPDYIATDTATKHDVFARGEVGIMVGNIWYNTMIESIKDVYSISATEAKTRFAIIEPPAGEDGSYGMRGNPGFWCMTGIRGNVSVRRREIILSLLDYLLSPEGKDLFTYGIEGTHYQVTDGKKVSKMGADSKGYNYTIEGKDPAFALSSLVDWTYSNLSPYQTNYEEIKELFEKAAGYERVDPVVYVQTPLYIENEQVLGNNSIDEFVAIISKNYSDANYNSGTAISWSNLSLTSASFNSDFASFKNKYLTTWGGQAFINEYNATAKKFL